MEHAIRRGCWTGSAAHESPLATACPILKDLPSCLRWLRLPSRETVLLEEAPTLKGGPTLQAIALHRELTGKLKAECESLRQRLVQAEGDVLIERRARIRLEAEFTELERRVGRCARCRR